MLRGQCPTATPRRLPRACRQVAAAESDRHRSAQGGAIVGRLQCEFITKPACSTHHLIGPGLPTLHRPSTHPQGEPHDRQFQS